LCVKLIDDIQFFAGKDRTKEEFVSPTFNALLEGGSRMILTCDRYRQKEISSAFGLRRSSLKSRFGWGLTVAIERARNLKRELPNFD